MSMTPGYGYGIFERVLVPRYWFGYEYAWYPGMDTGIFVRVLVPGYWFGYEYAWYPGMGMGTGTGTKLHMQT